MFPHKSSGKENAIGKGDVKINVKNSLPLDKAGEAHQNLEERKTTGSIQIQLKDIRPGIMANRVKILSFGSDTLMINFSGD